MNLNNFNLLKEDDDSFHVAHPNGKKMVIAKKGLSEKAHKAIKGMKTQHFDDGGMPADSTGQPIPAVQEMAAQDQNKANADAQFSSDMKNAAEKGVDVNVPGVTMGPQPAPQGYVAPAAPQVDATAAPYAAEKEANMAIANAAAGQGQQETQAMKETQNKIESMPTPAQIVDANRVKSDALLKAYTDQKIDPDRYWNSKSTGSKILAGIGVLLGGPGTGFGQTNAAAQSIQNHINADIDAQRADQSKAMNLWKMNREVMGDDLSANLATQNQMYTGLKYKLAAAASQFKGQVAIAQAKAANALIDQKMAANNMILGFTHGAPGNEQDYAGKLQAMERLAPDVYKDQQAKYVPGIGVAKIPITPEDRKTLVKYDDFGKQLDQAMNFQKNVAGSMGAWSPANRAEAESIQNNMVTSLNDLKGLNRFTEPEAERYEHIIGKIGSVNLTGSEIAKLDYLKGQLSERSQSLTNSLGIKPFEKAPVDQSAVQWAKQNPHDPRSAQIFRVNGVK